MGNDMTVQRFYWPRHIRLSETGALIIKTTAYDEDTAHWIEYLTVEQSDADYPFWLWLRQVKAPQEVLGEQDVAALRNEFEQTLRQKHLMAA